jgi:YD repeat-containing protein
MSLGYDAASQISFIADPVNLADTANYGYDALSRLTGYTQSAINQSFGYDPNGNRTSQVIGSTQSTYSYAADSNRLTGIQTGASVQTVTGDANGSTTSDATRQYSYDLRGRLVQTTTAQGVINYEVNALGFRTRKQAPYANSDTTYHYDTAGHLIGESDTNTGRYTREYIYLNDQPVAVMQ